MKHDYIIKLYIFIDMNAEKRNLTWSNIDKVRLDYPYIPKTYLAYNEQIKTNNDKDCLTVKNDGKLTLNKCNSNNKNQKFNYVYEDAKLYFTTQNDECIFVDND